MTVFHNRWAFFFMWFLSPFWIVICLLAFLSPFPQPPSHVFLKVFLIHCFVIPYSFSTVSPDLFLNAFSLLPVYQVPVLVRYKTWNCFFNFILLIKCVSPTTHTHTQASCRPENCSWLCNEIRRKTHSASNIFLAVILPSFTRTSAVFTVSIFSLNYGLLIISIGFISFFLLKKCHIRNPFINALQLKQFWKKTQFLYAANLFSESF
jgi:hypothetical protein